MLNNGTESYYWNLKCRFKRYLIEEIGIDPLTFCLLIFLIILITGYFLVSFLIMFQNVKSHFLNQ